MHRKYVIPFLLACIILACTQLTGINSIIGYCTTILIQAGLSDVAAHWGYVIFTSVNFLLTMVGVMLVDRKGRKFLLSLGSAGIIASLVCVGLVFRQTEKTHVDCKDAAGGDGPRLPGRQRDVRQERRSIPHQGHNVYPGRRYRRQGVGWREEVSLELDREIATAKIRKDDEKKSAKVEVAFRGDKAAARTCRSISTKRSSIPLRRKARS